MSKLPENISLVEITSSEWSEQAKYELLRSALQDLGFRKSSSFRGVPQKWIMEFWLSSEPGIFATIFDPHSKDRGVHSGVGVIKRDGSIIVFENTEECGLQHRQPDRWPHCGLVEPSALLERALRERHLGDADVLDVLTCVRVYEQAVNEDLEWRRKNGFSIEEIRNVLARMKKKGLLAKSLPPLG
jgi:hypothetical protein